MVNYNIKTKMNNIGQLGKQILHLRRSTESGSLDLCFYIF